MTKKPEKTVEPEWEKARDDANKATMASSKALQDDALTDADVPIEKLNTKLDN